MSWLYDKRPLEKGDRKNKDDWGLMCGYCKNTFQADEEQYDEHMDSPKHTMCRGENHKFNKQLAIERGIYVDKSKQKPIVDVCDPEYDEVILSRKRKIAELMRNKNAN